MEHKQLVSLVAAVLATRAERGDLDTAVKDAEELVKLVNTGKHTPKSEWDGKIKTI